MNAITIENLKKTFRTGFLKRRVDVLHGVDLEVERGEIFGLLGPNGAGKTTTLKCLLRLIFPTEGRITVFGVDNDRPDSLARVGYLPEHPALYPRLLPREILDLAGRLAGLPRDERRARSEFLLERVGLSDARDRAVGRFSKGMKQRVGLAQALMGDPDLLILDEPLSGLDPIGRKDVREILLEQRAAGKTLIFTSHILSDVERLCDRVAILKDGRVSTAPTTLGSLLRPEVRRFEVHVDELSERLEAIFEGRIKRLPSADQGVLIVLEGENDLDEFIDRARGEGKRILSIRPLRETLEALFLRDAIEEQSA